jgi:hypothetical protein
MDNVQKHNFCIKVWKEISLLHVVQTGSGAHTATYTMGTRGSFPGGKAAGELNCPLTSN